MSSVLAVDLAGIIERECRENVFLCYQCGKCSSGCPLAEHFDLTPGQIIRALQLGQIEKVLSSRTIWLCAMCETCATRCPQEIGITRIMDYLKITAQREGIRPAVPSVPLFYQAAIRGIRWFGRMYEAGLMGEFYLRQFAGRRLDVGRLARKDLPVALKMLREGKLPLLPHPARPKTEKRRREKRPTIAYYPGCSLKGTALEYDLSAKAVLKKLAVDFEEPKDWGCCGSTPAHSSDHFFSTFTPLKNVSMIGSRGMNRLTTPCPSCLMRTRVSLAEVRADGELQKRVAGEIPNFFLDDFQAEHLLDTIGKEIGLAELKKRVKRPLASLPVVCYYGCIITRPPEVTGVIDYEYPVLMDRLVSALGATPLDWSYKTRCCGATHGITNPDLALSLTAKILKNAQALGARAIVVACPLCQINLDARQGQINEALDENFQIPIVYFTQLIGVALGLPEGELGLTKHFIDPSRLFN